MLKLFFGFFFLQVRVPSESDLGVDDLSSVAKVRPDFFSSLDWTEGDDAGDDAEPRVIDGAVGGVGIERMLDLV